MICTNFAYFFFSFSDDLTYQTESKKNNHGQVNSRNRNGGGQLSDKRGGHHVELDEQNQGPNGNPQKSSFGSSFFSNSSNSCHRRSQNHLSFIFNGFFLSLLLLVTSSLLSCNNPCYYY